MERLTIETGLKAGFFMLRHQPTRSNFRTQIRQPTTSIFYNGTKAGPPRKNGKKPFKVKNRVTTTEAKNCEYYLILRKSRTTTEWQKTNHTLAFNMAKNPCHGRGGKKLLYPENRTRL